MEKKRLRRAVVLGERSEDKGSWGIVAVLTCTAMPARPVGRVSQSQFVLALRRWPSSADRQRKCQMLASAMSG
jgi:hypothetical protein